MAWSHHWGVWDWLSLFGFPINHTRKMESHHQARRTPSSQVDGGRDPGPCSVWSAVAEWQLWLAHRSGPPDWRAEGSKPAVALTLLIKEGQGHRQASGATLLCSPAGCSLGHAEKCPSSHFSFLAVARNKLITRVKILMQFCNRSHERVHPQLGDPPWPRFYKRASLSSSRIEKSSGHNLDFDHL